MIFPESRDFPGFYSRKVRKIRILLAPAHYIRYNPTQMVVIRGAAHDAEHEKKVKQVKHVLSDVMLGGATAQSQEFHAYGTRPQTVIRGIYDRPTSVISLGKVKRSVPVDPMLSFSKSNPASDDAESHSMGSPFTSSASASAPQAPAASSAPLPPPIDPSLYEDDVAVYRARAERQVDQELSLYRQQMMATINKEKQDVLARAYQEGVAKAQREAEAEYQRDAQELFTAINTIQDQRYVIVEREQQDLIDLSLKIAGAVIERELEYAPDIIFNIVKKALEKVTDTDKVIIKVHPDSVGIVREHQNDLLAMMPDIRQLQIQGDERIHRGGCVIETKLGFVDASVNTKLETIRQALLGATGG